MSEINYSEIKQTSASLTRHVSGSWATFHFDFPLIQDSWELYFAAISRAFARAGL